MDNNQYNEQRYNRKKQWYRLILGLQQLICHPLINLIWILYAGGVVLFVIVEKKLVSNFEVYPMLKPVFDTCMEIIVIFFLVICAIGIIQFIGLLTAMRDEADLSIVFGDKRDIKNQPSLLIYKSTDRKFGVTKREFYTTIPMERWQEKKDAICDRMNIHIIGEMTYGGKRKNIGNRIIIKSAKGRRSKERGALYDDTF